MARLTSELSDLFVQSHKLEAEIKESWGRLDMKSEWEYRRLGELVSFSSGGTPSKKRIDYWNGDIPWISAKH